MLKQFRSICAVVCIGILCTAVSGCALFGSELDKAAEAAGKLVTFYCDNIPNEAVREQFRAAVNQHAAPNAVNVTCANGSAPLAVPSNTGAHDMSTTNPNEKARLEKRNKAVADAEAKAPPAFDPASIAGGHAAELTLLSERLDKLEAFASTTLSRLSSVESSVSSLNSRVGSLETTASAHDSRLTSLERRTG